MRILHVTEAAGGGTLGVVTALSERLDRMGHQVALAVGVRAETPADLRERLPPDVHLARLAWSGRSPARHVSAARALRRLVRDWRPDVVHLHSSFAGAVGAVACGGPAIVYTPHGYAFAREPRGRGRMAAYRAAERVVARRCDVVAAVSEAEGALARDVLRAPRVCVVPNGIPLLDDGAAGDGRAARLVVGMGRMGAARRPVATARMLRAVAGDAEVAWIGGAADGEDAPLRAAGVAVTGWLPQGDALELLARATVMLHWSAWDGASLAVLEAIACGVVVVASDIPANRELVGADQVFRDEAAAVARIRALLADDGLRGAVAERQRARVAGRGADLMTERHVAVYARALARRAHRNGTAAATAAAEGYGWT